MKDIIAKAVEGGLEDGKLWELSCDNTAYINELIFSHDFLKAFFGDVEICKQCLTQSNMKHELWCNFQEGSLTEISWQYHGKQLVLSEDRLEYLRRFIDA